MKHIRNVAWSVAVGFQMQKNDVILVDNERLAHARYVLYNSQIHHDGCIYIDNIQIFFSNIFTCYSMMMPIAFCFRLNYTGNRTLFVALLNETQTTNPFNSAKMEHMQESRVFANSHFLIDSPRLKCHGECITRVPQLITVYTELILKRSYKLVPLRKFSLQKNESDTMRFTSDEMYLAVLGSRTYYLQRNVSYYLCLFVCSGCNF